MKLARIALTALFVVALLAGLALALPATSNVAASGEQGGGITGWNGIFTVGGSVLADTAFVGAIYSADYGSAQIDLTIDVTGSQQITLIPQYSNQPVVCTSVTQWFTATDYVYTTAQLTNTVQSAALVPSFSQSGDGTVGREVSVYGRCLRFKLVTDSVGQVFTPTIYVRLVDRQ